MGSPNKAGTRLLARFCNGACFGFGFVVASLVFTAMLWIIWFYFGLSIIHITDAQRRSLVNYSVVNPKASTSSTTPAPIRTTTSVTEETSNSISKSPTAASALRGSSRGELPKIDKRKEGPSGTLLKGDYADRDRVGHNVSNTRTTTKAPLVSPSPHGVSKLESPAAILSGSSSEEIDDDRIHARRVLPAGTENRPEVTSGHDSPSAKRNPSDIEAPDISPTKVRDIEPSTGHPRSPADDGDRKNRGSQPDVYEDKYSTSRRDEIQSSRRGDQHYRDPDFDRDYSERGRDRTRYGDDDESDRKSLGRYDRDRVRDKDDRYPKGDSRVYPDDEGRSYSRDRPRERYPDDSPRRGDEDRLRGYEERAENPDRKYLSSSRERTADESGSRPDRDDRNVRRDDGYKYRDDDRYLSRGDERYVPKDDDRYRARDDDRYRSRDDERYEPRDDDKYRSRDDDRYRTRDDDRYRSRDDDKYRLRDEDRYRSRDDERYRQRDDDKYRPVDPDRYRGRDDERYKLRDDERAKSDERYSSSSDRDRDRERYDDRYYKDDKYVSRDNDKYVSRDDDRDSRRYIERSRVDDRLRDRDLTDSLTRSRIQTSEVDQIQPSRSRIDDFSDTYTRPVRSKLVEDSSNERETPSRSRIVEDSPDSRDRVRPDSVLRKDQRDKSYTRDVASSSRPSRPTVEDKLLDRDDGYRKYYDDDGRERRISPTRTREEPSLPRSPLVDSRPSRQNDDSRYKDDDKYYEDRRILNTRVDTVSSSYLSRPATDEYKTRVPERIDDRREEVVLDRRSYASEEVDDYGRNSRPRNRYDYEDKRPDDTRRVDRDDERYVRRDPIESSRSRTDERPSTRERTEGDYRKYDDQYDSRYLREEDKPPPPAVRNRDSYYDDRTRSPNNRDRKEDEYERPRVNRPVDDDRLPRDEYSSSRSRGTYDDSPSDSRRRYSDDSKEPLIGSSMTPIYSRGRSDVDTESRRPAPYVDGYRERDERDVPRPPYSQERPLSAKEVIDTAIRQADSSQNQRKVYYPVYDPRVANLTSEIILPKERRGTTITAKRRRSI